MSRRVLPVVALVIVVSSLSSTTVHAAPCWEPPVAGTVVDPFREPPCPYCPGNRGLEYRVGARTTVVAAASGTVTWAGMIAGTRYVVVRHTNGWRVTYGRLDTSDLRAGAAVLSGHTIGTASTTFYFGVRVGDRYVDPTPHLGSPVGRPRLVPTDGTRARPAPPARLRCESSPPPATRPDAR